MPAPLKPGDTIAIAAPAGLPHDPQDFYRGVAVLQEMGFSVKFPRNGWQQKDFFWLAGSEQERAEELNYLWADSEVAAIFALRGGFGSLQILNLLDWEMIVKIPKLLIGFSDITVLLNTFAEKTGLSLHAPVVNSLDKTSPAALHWLYRCLTTPLYEYPSLPLPSLEIIQDGEYVCAPLVGGNLATLVTLLATPWDVNFSGKILFLEDVGEPLYKIDRMLTQLSLAGKLNGVKGVLLGDFHTTHQSAEHDTTAHLRYLETVWKLVLTHCQKLGNSCPIWANIPAGHCKANFALPIGATTVMDSRKKELHFKKS